MRFYNLIYIEIENKLIASYFATCAFASAIAQDALNAFLESPAIIEVQSKKQVLLSRAPASGPRKEGKVEGSQLRLYKAKEGSRKHEASHA